MADTTPRDPHAVAGRCPACHADTLFLASGGHVTCARLDCPNPALADDLLHDLTTGNRAELATAWRRIYAELHDTRTRLIRANPNSGLPDSATLAEALTAVETELESVYERIDSTDGFARETGDRNHDLETENAGLHRQLGELHGTVSRAMEARAEAVRREEAARRGQVEAEAAISRVRVTLDALETDPPATPTARDVIREVRTSLDGPTLRDRDDAPTFVGKPAEHPSNQPAYLEPAAEVASRQHVRDLIAQSSLGTPSAQALIRGDLDSPEAQAELAQLEHDLQTANTCPRCRQPWIRHDDSEPGSSICPPDATAAVRRTP